MKDILSRKVILFGILSGLAVFFACFILYAYRTNARQKALSSLENPKEVALACQTAIRILGTNRPVIFRGTDPALPAPLRDLKPLYVAVDDTQLRAEFHGGLFRYGLEFFRENSIRPDAPYLLTYYAYGHSRKRLYELE